jgi:hypothetical protein
MDRSGLADDRSGSNGFWCFGRNRLLNVVDGGGADAVRIGRSMDRGMNG